MKVKEAIAEITAQRKEKISYEKMGFALSKTRQRIGQILNDDLSDKQIKELENYFNVNLTGVKFPKNDIVKIPYWSKLPTELRNPDFTCVAAERNVILNHWYLKPENLCIVPMVGDKMAHYWYPINNGDILIIDTEQQHIRGNGVYFATSQNNTRFWVREMQVLVNNNIEFKGFAPSGETVRTLSQEELKEVDFKIIGKVIKNVSFRL